MAKSKSAKSGQKGKQVRAEKKSRQRQRPRNEDKPIGHHPADNIPAEDLPENNLHLFEYIFPVETFEELLGQQEYADVQVASDVDRVYCYDVMMRSPHAVERAVVRQHLERAVEQIPESPIAHVQWRVELSAVVVADQQIAAQIRVAYLQRMH